MRASATRKARAFVLLLAGAVAWASAPATAPPASAAASAPLALPLKQGSLRFAVIGDSGTGTGAQNELARLLAELLRQRHGAVGLVVAVLGVLRGLDLRGKRGRVRRQPFQRLVKELLEMCQQLHDGGYPSRLIRRASRVSGGS